MRLRARSLNPRWPVRLMRLSPEAHRQVEEFMRVYFRDPQLKLPSIKIYGGKLGRLVTKLLNISAITIGRRIIVTPQLVRRDEAQRVTLPGWLLAHECAHVMQYERAGMLGFLASYLNEYVKTLRLSRKLDAGARNTAYRAIRHEREARAAEAEYAEWLAAGAARACAAQDRKERSAQPEEA